MNGNEYNLKAVVIASTIPTGEESVLRELRICILGLSKLLVNIDYRNLISSIAENVNLVNVTYLNRN